jgi:integrase
MKQTLTDRFVRSVAPPLAGRAYYWDALVPGFGLGVTAKGNKSYVAYARWNGKSPSRRFVGYADTMPLAAARAKARQLLGMLAEGIDPKQQELELKLAAQQRARTRFAKVCEDWFPEIKKQRKAAAVERAVRREFIPLWGDWPVTEITTINIRDAIKAKAVTAPAHAHGLLGYAKRLFAWAVDQQIYGLQESPAAKLKAQKIIGRRTVRQHVMTDAEFAALWRAATAMPYPYGPLYRLLMLTGQRRSEVGEARWSEFDLDKRLWTIPPERMKMNAAHVVPLSAPALELLAALPRFKRGDFVFSITFGSKPVGAFSHAKERLDELMRAELPDFDPFVIHDIRRTMRTHLSALPISDRVRELVIAHAQPGLHKVYDQHSYLDEKRRALDLWAKRLSSIVSPQPNVVPLRVP